MSAYMVNKAHIDALVTTALRGPNPERGITPESIWTGCILRWFARPINHSTSFEEACALQREARYDEAPRIGAFLIEENLRSVRYRYQDDSDNLPGPADPYWLTPYEYTIFAHTQISTVAALKALDGYEYQSCEHPRWRISEAFQFCEALRRKLIGTLAGYEEAAWEITPRRKLTVLNGNGGQPRREEVSLK